MESLNSLHVLENIESEFNHLLKNPEIYVEPQTKKADSFKELSKKTYNTAVRYNEKIKGRSLPQLLVNGFDEEQIWQQCDLLNKAALSNISLIVHDINPKNILSVCRTYRIKSSANEHTKVSEEIENDKVSVKSEDYTVSSEDSSAGEEYAFDDDSDSPTEMGNYNKKLSLLKKKSSCESDDDNDSDFSIEGKSDVIKKTLSPEKSNYKSKLDDQFFKLSKLKDFLNTEDVKAEKEDEIQSDNEIDFFQDIPSDDNDDFDEESGDDDGKIKKSSRDLMYEDFFDDPESEVGDENDNSIDDQNETLMDETIGNDSALEMESHIDNNYNLEVESEKNICKTNSQKTAFELEQEKIRKKIQEYEKSMLEPLPWHLTGEVDSSKRPIDSLVHHETDFDSNIKQVHCVDKTKNEKIEEIARMTAMNKVFNDVERLYKPAKEIINYKKEIALDQTKSKKSLAEVYEEDYLKKQSKQDEEEENPKHKEIKKLMDSLFPQLHALFSHIPKPAIPEIKIVNNLPAITVEEVAPTAVSDVTLLAPEEVKKKSGLVKGKTERSDTDRKRERRKKKVHQKLKEKKRKEKLESLKENPSAKVSKLEKIETLKKLKQHKNTKIANVDEGGKIKSSKDFFARLQDTVDTKTKTKTEVSHKKKKIK